MQIQYFWTKISGSYVNKHKLKFFNSPVEYCSRSLLLSCIRYSVIKTTQKKRSETAFVNHLQTSGLPLELKKHQNIILQIFLMSTCNQIKYFKGGLNLTFKVSIRQMNHIHSYFKVRKIL